MRDDYEFYTKGYWANIAWDLFDKPLLTKMRYELGDDMNKSDQMKKAEVDAKLNNECEAKKALRDTQIHKALSILDDTKTMNSGLDVVLRGDGTFASANGNYVSPAELLQKYYKVAKAVEKAYIYLHNA